MKCKYIIILLLITHTLVAQDNLEERNEWSLDFEDLGTTTNDNWKENWFLDGNDASIKYTDDGLLFKAANQINENATHAVLWTQKSFTGDVKIEYDFTRKDTIGNSVVILYILAEGRGDIPFNKDIYKWRDKRVLPFMYIYWWGMNAIHVSYATLTIKEDNYIRVRKYPVYPGSRSFHQTEIPPSISGEDLFKPDVTYHLTFVKKGDTLTFKISGDNKTRTFQWKNEQLGSICSGRIGLRQKLTRSSIYKDIRIYTKKAK